MASLPGGAGSNSKATQLLDGLAALPAGTNPYTWLRETGLPELLGIYAVIALLIIIGLFVRWRRQNLSYVKWLHLPGGNMICLSPTNCFFSLLLLFVLASQASLVFVVDIVQTALAPTQYNITRAYKYTISEFVFLVLLIASWAEMGGLVASCITSYFHVEQKIPKWFHVRLFNVFILAWPIAIFSAWLATFIVLHVRSTQFADAIEAVFAQVTDLEASWTGGSYITGLLALETPLLQVNKMGSAEETIAQAIAWLLIGHMLVLLCLWIPAALMSIGTLRSQIRNLTESKKFSSQLDMSMRSSTDVPATGLASTAAVEAAATRSFFGKSFMSLASRKTSSFNKQTSRLQNLCWQRIIVTVVFILALVPYFVVVGAAVGILRSAEDTGSIGRGAAALLTVGPYLGAMISSFPLACWFCWRSFDNTREVIGTLDPSASFASPSAVRHAKGNRSVLRSFMSGTKEDDQTTITGPLALGIRIKVERKVQVDIDDTHDDEARLPSPQLSTAAVV